MLQTRSLGWAPGLFPGGPNMGPVNVLRLEGSLCCRSEHLTVRLRGLTPGEPYVGRPPYVGMSALSGNSTTFPDTLGRVIIKEKPFSNSSNGSMCDTTGDMSSLPERRSPAT